MKYVAAYLLAVLGGKEKPSQGDLEKILSSVSCKIEKERIELLLNELKEKDIFQVISDGKAKLGSAPMGAAAGGAEEAKEEAKEEAPAEEAKEEEEDDESEEDMGLGLFGGSGSEDESD